MAAGGFKTFVAGEILTAADTNSFLMQGVLVFEDAAARDAAITSPVEGQFAFLKDTNILTFYDGSSFVEFSTFPEPAVASGGTEVTSDGFRYHTFKANGTLTITEPGFVEVLVVAGGGSGGGNRGDNRLAGGGGGAGQVRNNPSVFMAAGSVAIVVGGGGASVNTERPGNIGNNSTVTYTGLGGSKISAFGGGPGSDGSDGLAGGSSGGLGSNSANADKGAAHLDSPFILGHSGGFGAINPTNGAAGGGGGAGAGGGNATVNVAGVGGVGTTLFSAYGLATSTGQLSGGVRFYGGGGGGGGSTRAGGLGGGGTGALNGGTGGSGTANTGGGGGGTEQGGTSGAGGSGIVIVRRAV